MKIILEADAEKNVIKALGIALNVNLSKVKILVNGSDIGEIIKLKELKIVEED